MLADYTPSPGLSASDPPPLWELGASRFESLGRSLLEYERGVDSCEQYGEPGQTQFGIDLQADMAKGDEIIVGQCKCHRKFGAADIRAAADDFLKFWETHWKDRHVVRFILMVACDLKESKCKNQIEAEKQRFKTHGVVFRIWSRRTLLQRIAPWRDVVSNHFHPPEYWMERLTGRKQLPFLQSASDPTHASRGAADAEIQALVARATDGVTRILDGIREKVRRGLTSEASLELQGIRADAGVWDKLPDDIKTKTLRLSATLLLDDARNVVAAKSLAEEARRIDREPHSVIDTLIVLREDGAETALQLLGIGPDPTQDLARIRASCLLRIDKPSDAVSVLRAVSETFEPETHRLFALCLLASGKITEAEWHARTSLEGAPDSWLSRMTLGIVLYGRAMSPAVPPAFGPWPIPVDWSLVKRDDESVGKLREAHDTFSKLLVSGQECVSVTDVEGWMLACLANDPERRGKAEAFATKLMARDRAHPAAVAWALARALPFDAVASQQALDGILRNGHGDAFHVAALVGIYLASSKTRKAAAALKAFKEVFVESGLPGFLEFLREQVAIQNGDTAIGAVGEPGPNMVLAVTRAARDRDQNAGNLALVDLASQCIASGHAFVLVDCLAPLAERGRWEAVSPFANALLEQVGTCDAVGLAARAVAAVGDFGRAVAILQSGLDNFPGGTLPHSLQHLRVDCLRRQGRLQEAISAATKFRLDPHGLEHASVEADLHLLQGDFRRAATLILDLRKAGKIPPSQAIRYARALWITEPKLSRQLLLDGASGNLDDAFVPIAFETGHLLGLGREMSPILSRMQAIATTGQPNGVVVSLTLDDLREMLLERTRENELLWKQMREGTAPIHCLAPSLSISLSDMFHRLPGLREGDPSQPNTSDVRSGGRRLPANLTFPQAIDGVRIHLDITTLLLLAHLDVLSEVEGLFRPILISSMLPTAIIEMLDDEAKVATLNKAERQLVHLVSSGRLEEIFSPQIGHNSISMNATTPQERWMAENALESDGALVAWNGPDESVPKHLADRFMNLAGFIEMLRAEGVLDDTEAAKILRELGASAEVAPRHFPLGQGSPIYFYANTPVRLAELGVLGRSLPRHRILLDGHYVAFARTNVERADIAVEASVWLERILERLRQGLQDATYECVPLARISEAPPSIGLLQQCLFDVMAAVGRPGDIICVDDRFLGGVAWKKQLPILGTPEILQALRASGAIEDDRFFGLVHRLRAGKFAYLPPFEGELARLLRGSLRPDGVIVETDELASLRRYFATCLANEEFLQRQGTVTNSGAVMPGELGFVTAWSQAAAQAIGSGWLDASLTEHQRVAMAEWVLTNIDVHSYRTFPVLGGPQGPVHLLATHLATLVAQAVFVVNTLDPNWRERCLGYLQWLEERVLRPRFKADPEIAQLVGQAVRRILAPEDKLDVEPSAEQRFKAELLRRFLSALPESLLCHIPEDDAVLWQALQCNPPGPAINIGNHGFSLPEFWLKVAKALVSEASSMQTLAGLTATILAEIDTQDDAPTVQVEVEGHKPMWIGDSQMGLLCGDVESRRRLLKDNPSWFDLPGPEAKRFVERIASDHDPASRMASVGAAKAASMAHLYETFAAKLSSGEEASFIEFQPQSVQALLRHLRLPPDGGLSDRLELAAASLIEHEGIDEAFRRLSGIPVPLPETFLATLDALPPDEAAAIVLNWAKLPGPVSRLHTVRAAVRVCSKHGADLLDVGAMLDVVLNEAEDGGATDVFLAVLSAASSWFGDWAGASDCPIGDQLVLCWTHTHRLFCAMVAVGCPIDSIADAFSSHWGPVIVDYLATGWRRDDVAHPLLVDRHRFVVQGLDYALGPRAHNLIDVDRQAKLRSLVVVTTADKALPVQSLLRDQRLATNEMSSFLAGELSLPLLELLGEEILESYRASAIQVRAEAAVEHLIIGDRDAIHWLELHLAAGPCPLPLSIQSRFLDALRVTPFATLFQYGVQAGMAVVRLVAMQAGRSGDQAAVDLVAENFGAILIALREGAAKGRISTDQHSLVLGAILTSCALLSLGDTVEKRTESFVALLRTTLGTEPIFNGPMRKALSVFCSDLPFRAARKLWPFLIEMRAR